jgi:hypothetical protein
MLVFLAACSRTPDAIDKLVADLSSTEGMWINGWWSDVRLPKPASLQSVVDEIVKQKIFDTSQAKPPVQGNVTRNTILQIRRVHIRVLSRSDTYTAVLIDTQYGQKILLFKPGSTWEFRSYDANHYYGKLSDAEFKMTPLHSAAGGDDKTKVEFLLNQKADVNARTIGGWTPLHYAALGGRIDNLKLLLAHQADINATNQMGQTSLHVAVLLGHKEAVQLLLDNNADVNAKAGDGRTPLDYAMESRNTNIAELLRQHGGHTRPY